MQDNKYKRSLKILDQIEQEIGLSEDLSLQKHQIYAFLNKKKKAIEDAIKSLKKAHESKDVDKIRF